MRQFNIWYAVNISNTIISWLLIKVGYNIVHLVGYISGLYLIKYKVQRNITLNKRY